MTRRYPAPPPRLAIALIAGISAMFLALGTYTGWSSSMLMTSGIRAQAQIIDTEIRATGHKGAYVLYPIVAFETTQGTAIKVKARNSSDLPTGTAVMVIFDSTEPAKVYLYTETSFWLLPAIFCGIGIFGLLFAIMLNNRARELRRHQSR